MKKLFICHTPYHVLVTLVKSLQSKEEEQEILISEEIENVGFLCENLEKTQLYDSVKVFKNNKLMSSNRLFLKYSTMHKALKNLYGDLDFSQRDIYIFNDWTPIGYYLNLEKKYYHLLEDGLDCYKAGGVMEEYYRGFSKMSHRIRRFLHYGVFYLGESYYMIDLEVNSMDHLCIRKCRNIVVYHKKEQFSNLAKQQKEIIVKVFLDEQSILSELKKDNPVSIFLTQPLYKDCLVKNKKIQIELYRYLMKKYGKGTVWIKPHPRDDIDYKKVFPGCHVLDQKNVPMEVFDFIEDLKCERVITAYSTAIRGIEFCKEKIFFDKDTIDRMCEYIEKELENDENHDAVWGI